MKKILYIVMLTFCLIFTYNAQAFEMKAAEELDIVNNVEGDLYSAGGRTDLSANIDGDFVAAGGEIHVDGEITQDAILLGWEVVISQVVGDDVRVAWGSVIIQADIMWDLIVFGGDVRVDKTARVHGDVVAYAGQIIIDGNVSGDLRIGAGKLVLNGQVAGNANIEVDAFSSPSGSGAIAGDLVYTHNKKLSSLESLASGKIDFQIREIEDWEEGILEAAIGYYVYKIIGVFIFACLLYFLFEKVFIRIGQKLVDQTLKSALYSCFLVVVTPVIIVLLCITVIGIPFALLLTCLYIFMFVFAKLLNVVVITSVVKEKYKIDVLWKKVALLFAFTVLFCTIWILSVIAAAFTLWAVILYKAEVIQSLRK